MIVSNHLFHIHFHGDTINANIKDVACVQNPDYNPESKPASAFSFNHPKLKFSLK